MKSGVKRLLAVVPFLFVWLTFFSSSCFSAAVMPPPTQDFYLVDDAGMVAPEDRETLLAAGRELEERTGAQIVVVTMNTLGGENLEEDANRLFRAWGIGDRQKNNGVLLLIVKEDRRFRIEVGYGLEGTITDGYGITSTYS